MELIINLINCLNYMKENFSERPIEAEADDPAADFKKIEADIPRFNEKFLERLKELTEGNLHDALTLRPGSLDTLSALLDLRVLTRTHLEVLAKNLKETSDILYEDSSVDESDFSESLRKERLGEERKKRGEGRFWSAPWLFRERAGSSGHGVPFFAWFAKTPTGVKCIGEEFQGDQSNAPGDFGGLDFDAAHRANLPRKYQGKYQRY